MHRFWAPIAVAVMLASIASLLALQGASAGVLPVTVAAIRPESPAVAGSTLVWADRRSTHYDVYAYDAVTRTTKRLTSDGADHIQPAVCGGLVVWTDYRNADADIYGYDLATDAQRPLVVSAGDQIAPSVSSRWLVWEDRSSGYSGSIKALDLSRPGSAAIPVASYGRHPQVAGDLVVWEDTSKPAPDIKAKNLATGSFYNVATSSYAEQLPSTDGRYVAWAQDNGTDLDVRAFDTVTGRYLTCAASRGEQSFPEVGNGVVYWVDNVAGQRLHVDSYDIASGRTARFNDFGTEDVAAVSASGSDVAWLAKAGQAWQLRATFGAGEVVTSALSRLVPAAVPAVRLAQLSADPAPPEVVATSVQRGAVNVPRDSSFSVYFSERLDPASVGPGAVRILDARGRVVRARLRYSALAKAVTLTPGSPLGRGTYTLAVAPSVADPSGNTLGDPLAVSFSTVGVLADTMPPTQPTSLVTSVYQGDRVQLTWWPSSDDVGVNGYLVYRSLAAASAISSFPADASFVASTTATGTVVPLAADEKAKSFTYYYVVVARDAALNVSAPSYNDAPDPHGTFTSGKSTNLCMRCHAIHGNAATQALGAKSAGACYACHGSTPATSAYGLASSMDAQADFRDDAVISTAGPEIAGRGSIHRDAYMAVVQRECDACHTPHKEAYNASASDSYNRLLRTQLSTDPAGYHYNTDAAAIGNRFCADCHGSSVTNIAIIGGDTAYSETGGDHLAKYTVSAHATASVPPNSANPAIQCEACHNNHASPVAKLIDYRDSATATVVYDQSGLCFACHSAAGQETSKPNTWNGRDVKAESVRTSHHPTTGGTVTCVNCHNAHNVQKGAAATPWQVARVSDPSNTATGWAGGTADFCLSCHDGTPPVSAISASAIVPYTVSFRAMSSYPYFPGWSKAADFKSTGHYLTSTANGRAWCENCHDPHGSDFSRLVGFSSSNAFAGATAAMRTGSTDTNAANRNQTFGRSVSKEEALCLQCHGDGASYTNSQTVVIATKKAPSAQNVAGAMRGTYYHGISQYADRHSDIESASAFGSSNRHAECVDCHDPHASRTTTGTVGQAYHAQNNNSLAGGALRGASGVVPTWLTTQWFAPTLYAVKRFDGTTSGSNADIEAYLCFKCHSGNSGQPFSVGTASGTYTSTNLAIEFNPNNDSGHNVLGTRTSWPKTSGFQSNPSGTWAWPASATFKTGWSSASRLTCTDCHTSTSAAKGPHGSTVKYLVDPNYSGDWESAYISTTGTNGASSNIICNKCHNNIAGLNAVHNDTHHQNATTGGCVACHIRIPHGWKRPRMLGYSTDPAPYASTRLTGITVTNVDFSVGASINSNNCVAGCNRHTTGSGVWP